MLKHGLYKHECVYCGVNVGKIILEVKETPSSFKFKLIENTIRYDAPHIEDMFRDKDTVVIKKAGSKHALNIVGDDWFCLYPYRCGVPYPFRFMT